MALDAMSQHGLWCHVSLQPRLTAQPDQIQMQNEKAVTTNHQNQMAFRTTLIPLRNRLPILTIDRRQN